MTTLPAGSADTPRSVATAITARPKPWLIGIDVDGTIAPIVARPEEAALAPNALDALLTLNASDDVQVVVVSGRPMADLTGRFGLPTSLMLFGSHGAETSAEPDPLSATEAEHLTSARSRLEAAARRLSGAWVESKPMAVALHVRQADPVMSTTVLAALAAELIAAPEFTVHNGHMVLEVAVRPTSKVVAFGQLKRRTGPATAVFIGDDSSDEAVFRSMEAGDVSVKVGPGPSRATHRLDDPTAVVDLLTALAHPPR